MRKLQVLLLSLLILFSSTSCAHRSLDDFQEEGEGVVRTLIQDLRLIQTRDDLIASSNKLQKHFEKLAYIMVEAENFYSSHREKERGDRLNHELSDQLRVELNRLYTLEGGRQVIEKIEERALCILYANKRDVRVF